MTHGCAVGGRPVRSPPKHAAGAGIAPAGRTGGRSTTAGQILIAAIWGHQRPPISEDLLPAVVGLAIRQQVPAQLARAYPVRLAELGQRTRRAGERFRRNLAEATALLAAAGVTPVLIKADPGKDYSYTNFDLVVGEDGWLPARRALAGWGTRHSTHALERHKLLVHPAGGPAAHLHREVSWFDVAVTGAAELRAGCSPDPDGGHWWLPSAADALRIWVAHAVFQNLAFDLSELDALRRLARPDRVAQAGAVAAREGWGRAFDSAWTVAQEAIAALERAAARPWQEHTPPPELLHGPPPDLPPDLPHGPPPDLPLVRLPVPLPVPDALRCASEHAGHLARTGRPRSALRELALRPVLVAAKRRRLGRS